MADWWDRRAQGLMAGQKTSYDAASLTDARLADWIPNAGSADADILPERHRILSRSRDLTRNVGIAAGYVRSSQDTIIGHLLRLNATPDYVLLGRDKEWAKAWSRTTEGEFRTWADTTECDATGQSTLWGLARQALGNTMVSGDHVTLPLWLPRAGARWSTRLQSIESDRLSTPPRLAADTLVREGIRIDQYGAPITYYLQKNHPGDVYGLTGQFAPDEWEAVPAVTPWGRRRVIHLFDAERPGQSRGVSAFTRVLRDFKVSSDYVGNELHASAANALFAAFLESDLDPASAAEVFGGDPTNNPYWSEVGKQYHRKKIESGLIMQLPVGARLNGYNPNRPNVAFAAFVEHVSRYISAGLNVPYEVLMKDFSKTNYSSARAAMLEAWRFFLSVRKHFVDQYLAPIYALWLEEAINVGRVEAPDYYQNQYAYQRARWTFAGRGWVDPKNEAMAAQIRMASGLTNLEIESAEQGVDWEESADQRAAERDYYLDLKLPDPYAAAAASSGSGAADSASNDPSPAQAEAPMPAPVAPPQQDINLSLTITPESRPVARTVRRNADGSLSLLYEDENAAHE